MINDTQKEYFNFNNMISIYDLLVILMKSSYWKITDAIYIKDNNSMIIGYRQIL
jgi:hypothetical protein